MAGDASWLKRSRLVVAVVGTDERCVVLEAQAGFGKSSLATQLLDDVAPRGAPAVRVVASPADDLTDIAAAIDRAAGPDEPAGDPRPAPPRALDSVLRSIDPNGLVVIDDAHRLPVAERARLWDLVATGVDPGTVRLVVCARPVDEPGLARAVVHGRVKVLGEADLAFSDDEIWELLATRSGAPFDGGMESGLLAWPALTERLADGSDVLVSAYLGSEVLPFLPPGAGRLIVALAVGGDTSDDAVTAVAHALGLETVVVDALAALWPVRTHGFAALLHRCWQRASAPFHAPDDAGTAARALSELDRTRGNLARAAQHAIRAGDRALLGLIAVDALMSISPSVSAETLDAWLASGLLDEPMRQFVELSAAVMRGALAPWVVEGFAECATAWAGTGGRREEVAALLATGLMARQLGDHVSVGWVLERADVIDDADVPEVGVLRELGHAVRAQLLGEPERALELAHHAAMLAPANYWRAECEMMIAGGELLLQRFDRAIAAYQRASIVGSDTSRALAYRAGAFARLDDADDERAVQDAATAVVLAHKTGNPMLAALTEATRDGLAALCGYHTDEADRREPRSFPVMVGDSRFDEIVAFQALERICGALNRHDVEGARRLADGLERVPERVIHVVALLCVLQIALGVRPASDWGPRAEVHPLWARFVEAGEAARAHLEGGPVPDERFHPFLPRVWTSNRSRVRVRLLGVAEVWADGLRVDHPHWSRGRVRELCAHLVVRPRVSRAARIGDLWPDLPAERGAANMRVTLTQLLGVLDPDREKGSRSGLFDESSSTMVLRQGHELSVDVWEAQVAVGRIDDALDAFDQGTALAEARRLTELVGKGTVFGGDLMAEWAGDAQRDFDRRVLDALESAAVLALRVGDASLAEALAACALRIDPWSESSGRHVVEARLQVGDVDGARRSLGRVLDLVAELEVAPQPETADLVARLGRPMRRRLPGDGPVPSV